MNINIGRFGAPFTLVNLIIALIIAVGTASVRAEDLKFITIEVAPWASRGAQSGKLEGAFIDIVEELEDRTDHEIRISVAPYARAERELESGAHDCTILVPLPESLVVPGELVFNHSLGAIARKDLNLGSYEDLKDLRISVLRGGSLNEQFDNDSSLYKEFDTDYIIGLRKIAHGRLDAIVGAISTLNHLAKQEQMADQLGEPLVLQEVPLYFQCSRNSVNLHTMEEINRALRLMKEDKTLASIKAKHHL